MPTKTPTRTRKTTKKLNSISRKTVSPELEGINLEVKPSGNGCKECLESNGWWMHLNRCAECGHVGCCDNSPNKHSRAHYHETKHPIIQRFEPGETWFYNWDEDRQFEDASIHLAKPIAHPIDQPVPGGHLPSEFQSF